MKNIQLPWCLQCNVAKLVVGSSNPKWTPLFMLCENSKLPWWKCFMVENIPGLNPISTSTTHLLYSFWRSVLQKQARPPLFFLWAKLKEKFNHLLLPFLELHLRHLRWMQNPTHKMQNNLNTSLVRRFPAYLSHKDAWSTLQALVV